MATILEGLNKLSGALGGAETATENLEALNAIAGALGGETNATNNADAIDQIAEHASGGGGGGDWSEATVTVGTTGQTTQENLTLYNVVTVVSEMQAAFVEASIVNQASATYTVLLYKGRNIVEDLDGIIVDYGGSITKNGDVYEITGDCSLTVKERQIS